MQLLFKHFNWFLYFSHLFESFFELFTYFRFLRLFVPTIFSLVQKNKNLRSPGLNDQAIDLLLFTPQQPTHSLHPATPPNLNFGGGRLNKISSNLIFTHTFSNIGWILLQFFLQIVCRNNFWSFCQNWFKKNGLHSIWMDYRGNYLKNHNVSIWKKNSQNHEGAA